MREKEKTFLTAEECLQMLREEIERAEKEGDKPGLTFEEITDIIDRAKPQELGLDNIKTAITNMLKRYKQFNANGDGLPMPVIWKRLKEGEPSVTSTVVEDALTALLQDNKIHTYRSGITYYRYGRDPEKEEIQKQGTEKPESKGQDKK